MKRFCMIFILVLLLFPSIYMSNGYGQDREPILNGGATLRGQAVDITPQQNPIEGARVEIVSSDGIVYTVTTDETGAYEKTGLAAGRYSTGVHKKGYGSRIGKMKVVASGGEGYDRN